ncbi:rod shape-determining protein MreC [Sulfurimonas sp. SAG-AH-194-I05]|nr:rod shape-determining protein MreC [Sulfurimonas sp. SAG-AH-194-I05]MDF1875179.1 rod shape-determining protein MreC [Sulfurimonas sp. SAG-AH-194-I05]
MNKELFSFLFTLIALVMGALYYTNTIQAPFINSLNYLKSSYHKTTTLIEKNIDKHVFQASTITSLKDTLQNYEKNHLVMQQLASEVNELFKANKSSLKNEPKVILTRVISYEKFGNFDRLWLDLEDYNNSKIYGLTYQELVAGIVIEKNNRPLALLNQDPKSAYAVHVGNVLAPGIAQGNNSENLIINFIPAWFLIKKDDEVVTSGLDNVFFKGLKVGKVLSVSKEHGFQTAIVEPYYKSNSPSYFHMIRIQR